MSYVTHYLAKESVADSYLKTKKYEVGDVLLTSNPYLCTNATIIEELVPNFMFKVLTDLGNIVNLSIHELKVYYLHPCFTRRK